MGGIRTRALGLAAGLTTAQFARSALPLTSALDGARLGGDDEKHAVAPGLSCATRGGLFAREYN